MPQLAPIDPQTVVAIVAIIQALANAAVLVINAWFGARRGAPAVEKQPPSTPEGQPVISSAKR